MVRNQWLIGAQGEPVAAENSCQLWLPVEFDPAVRSAWMVYRAEWDPFELE